MSIAGYLLICSAVLFFGARSNDVFAQDEKAVRELFVEIVRIERLPASERRKEIPRVYLNLFDPVVSQAYAVAYLPRSMPPLKSDKMSPEELADAVGSATGWGSVLYMARSRCLDMLRENPDILVPLVKRDLEGSDLTGRKRGLKLVSELPRPEYFDDVIGIFRDDTELSSTAAYSLRDLNDPRAIRPLIQKDPKQPTQYFEIMRFLSRKRKGDPELVRLLGSPDSKVRWQAAYALADSEDESLAGDAQKLMKDTCPAVREQGGAIAINLHANFSKVRPLLIQLLSDPDPMVRMNVAIWFASRGDKVCAPALLLLEKDASIGELYHSTVVQAIQNVTGTYFGYHIGSDAWRPDTENNKKAVKRFSEWIQENGPFH